MNISKLKGYIRHLFQKLSINKQKAQECWKVTSSGDLQTFLKHFLDYQQENIACIMKVMDVQLKIESILEESYKMSQEDYSVQCESKCAWICQFISNQLTGNEMPSQSFRKKQKQADKIYFLHSQKNKSHSEPLKQSIFGSNINSAHIGEPSNARDMILTKDIVVVVKYSESQVFPDYQHNTYNLKECLQRYIKRFLAQNKIEISSPQKIINILDEISYVKSSDAGNYKFDPFCDCIKIYITHIRDQFFTGNLQLNDAQNISIQHSYLTPQQKQQMGESLCGKDSITKLVKNLCVKKQQSAASYDQIVKAFTLGHGVTIISDLYPWTKSDYSDLKLKVTWIYELLDIVGQIKDFGEKTPESKERRIGNIDKNNCIKTANSHKILRYLVYKTYSFDELENLSKLNYQNMKKAINIVKKEIINEELLDNLQKYFFQFTVVPKKDEKSFGNSRGMILFGPPGTGKTELTQSLPNLIGFHLIEKGLSAADFMKTHVGQSSRMIRDLVNRAKLSPHLLCSIGIDEIDGLVPDRKDKDEKNKGQGISMLLSVIGGNKDVPNLVFMASTNYLKKIDQAIRRRLSGQFQVGRPNPQARRIMIQNDLPLLKYTPQILQKLKLITANFTGAALKRLNALIFMKMKKKQMENCKMKKKQMENCKMKKKQMENCKMKKKQMENCKMKKKQMENCSQNSLTVDEIFDGATQIAKQFSITLGQYTLPEIYALRNGNSFLFTLNFLNRISNHFLFVKYAEKREYKLYYANKIAGSRYKQYSSNKNTEFEMNETNAYLYNSGEQDHFNAFGAWAETFLNKSIKCQTLQKIRQQFKDRSQPTLMIIRDFQNMDNFIIQEKNIFSKPKKNLYVIYYIGYTNHTSFVQSLNWQINVKKPFSGKILVELNEQPRMAFQLNPSEQDEDKIYFKHFLKKQKTQSANDIVPQLINFFCQRQVNYTLLIDYQLILQNGAFDEQKMFQVIEEKMSEAANYSNVAVIINLDSLIVLNQSSSDSSMGRSKSYSIADHNMYRLLLHYMRQLAVIDTNGKFKKQKWVAIIAKNIQIIKIIKADLKWPFSPQQRQQYQKDELLEVDLRCTRCGLYYKQRQNIKQRKCMQHPGPLIDLHLKKIEENLTLPEARLRDRKYKQIVKNDNSKGRDELYAFACCMKGINQTGEFAYRHITIKQLNTEKDESWAQRQMRFQQWKQICRKL